MKKTYLTPEMLICKVQIEALPICVSPQTTNTSAQQSLGMDAKVRFIEEIEGEGGDADEDLW
ncbi:MAG: hypothetical protein IJP75_05535 [Bacteroidaceae bacterium]|nr:hypothetical protein [Bacteroidaceae bacterium]